MRALLATTRFLSLLLIPASGLAIEPAGSKDGRDTRGIAASYVGRPLSFEINRGQADPQVHFLARGSDYTLFLTSAEAVLVLSERGRTRGDRVRSDDLRVPSRPTRREPSEATLRMRVVGADPKVRLMGLNEAPGKSHYLTGSDPSAWHREVSHYERVAYREIHPGIDWLFHGNRGQLEFDFVVQPGSDAETLRLHFEGAEQIVLEDGGALALRLPGGRQILQHAPLAYQEIDGIRRAVESRYVLRAPREVGFRVGDFDRNRPLTIDPVLGYSTYLGGADDFTGDEAFAIAVDSFGNSYISGTTRAADFPTANALQPGFAPGRCGTISPNTPVPCPDVFVSKLSADGSTLLYSTYLGGSDSERFVGGIAVDAEGNAYLTGETASRDFPTTPGAFQTQHAGATDAFVVKIAPDGSNLVYSTYLGGSGPCCDVGHAIAVDAAGNAYVTGAGDSPDFPTLHPVQGAFAGFVDAFVAKLDPSGSALVYSTYLGGSAADQGFGIALDSAGSATVCGFTGSSDFPVANALQPAFAGVFDAFVAKLDREGSSLAYSTYLGGGSTEFATGIAVDRTGDAWVGGGTSSNDFPVGSGALQAVFGGGSSDAFVVEVASNGSSLLHATYLGGEGSESVGSIALAGDAAVVVGSTASDGFPTRNALQTARAGQDDAFLTVIDGSGSRLLFSTYLGGRGFDFAAAVAADAKGGAYVAGWTVSSDFPLANPLQATLAGFKDAFAVRLGGLIPREVDIDFKPGSEGNRIHPMSRGVVRVAILGSDDFDVAEVDVASLAFGPGGAEPVSAQSSPGVDVNGDGRADLVSRYRTQDAGIAPGDAEACVTGATLEGTPFRGCDRIVIVPRGSRRSLR